MQRSPVNESAVKLVCNRARVEDFSTAVSAQQCLAAHDSHFEGFGVNVCPSAVDRATNIRVAGDEHTAVLGSSVRTADDSQLPEGMSLFVCTATVVSVVVS